MLCYGVPKYIVKSLGKVIKGCRHSSVDSSAPSILPPWVHVPSTPYTLFQFILFKLYICYLIWNVKRTKNKNIKRPGLTHLKKILEFIKCWFSNESISFSLLASERTLLWNGQNCFSSRLVSPETHRHAKSQSLGATSRGITTLVVTKQSLGGSPGLVVMGGDSCSEGRGFESLHRIQEWHFAHFCCK